MVIDVFVGGLFWVWVEMLFVLEELQNVIVVFCVNLQVQVQFVVVLFFGVFMFVYCVDNDDCNVQVDCDGLFVQWFIKLLWGWVLYFCMSFVLDVLVLEWVIFGYNCFFGGLYLWVFVLEVEGLQWLCLDWEQLVMVFEICLVFDDDVDFEFNILYYYCSFDEVLFQFVCDYCVEVKLVGFVDWCIVVEEWDNCYWLCVYLLLVDFGVFMVVCFVVEWMNGVVEVCVIVF